jgi:DNA repair exonuclease SbcCD ATPase subunit
MSFKIKNVTIKNFLSIGNQTQAVNVEKDPLVLVLGENLDAGTDGSRNGTGKTALLNAISYALYGSAISSIKKENLINKINGKHMLVTVEFETKGNQYRIERGRKPNVLKLFVNNQEQHTKDSEDDAQGDNRETQKAIDHLIGMSHTMFKHLVALNTYTEPFLSMGAGAQREIIEQLLGMTVLSEKAENLKNAIKLTKDKIQSETFKIDAIKKANENIQRSIDSLTIKSNAWETKRTADVERMTDAILELHNVDIENELTMHQQLKKIAEVKNRHRELTRQKATLESALDQIHKTEEKYARNLASLDKKQCPSCEQPLHDSKHEEMKERAEHDLRDHQANSATLKSELDTVLIELVSIGDIPETFPDTFYDSEIAAMGHKNNLETLEKTLETRLSDPNPFLEQVTELQETALQVIDWTTVNELTKYRDHQEFLHKLLTNKDSFIRKKIINQNLSYLNKRLSYYIDHLGLPHLVVFQNDLTVQITQLGQDLDFDNLSRGERNRLILSMSFAFRDVWENLYQHINLLFVDELIDSGMDSAGVDAGLGVLKKMARERNKNIFLISHKDELVSRVGTVLKVTKESGFSSYASNTESISS